MTRSLAQRVRVQEERLQSDNWYILKTTSFDFLRRDGRWQRQQRETYDRGNGAAILLYNLAARRVILTRQFRYPAFVNGYEDLLIEVPAGLLDNASPEARIRAEAEEEAGFRVGEVRQVFATYMSPGSVTERLHCFVAEYLPSDRIGSGGGLAEEGEDIEVFETGIDAALADIDAGRIVDAKTIMLLQYSALRIFPKDAR